MTLYCQGEAVTLYLGDCREVLREIDADTFDAVVTDPPYGLGLMGKEWDAFKPSAVAQLEHSLKRKGTYRLAGQWPRKNGMNSQGTGVAVKYDESKNGHRHFQAWSEEWAAEALRVAKPGAHLVAFGGTRSFHRLTCAIEDAGWEIRDTLMRFWIFGSGFPKSLDVSKALDKAAGAKRETTGPKVYAGERGRHHSGVARGGSYNGFEHTGAAEGSLPATDLARQWEGWGTALKPAYEPIILARKPLAGTVAQNVERFGTGGMNVDGCRIEGPVGNNWEGFAGSGTGHGTVEGHGRFGKGVGGEVTPPHPSGRWPANVVLDEAAAALLDETVGVSRSDGGTAPHRTLGGNGVYQGGDEREYFHYGDSGGPSRFFYTAKASRAERERFLEGLERVDAQSTRWSGKGMPRRRNHHPTVKPVDLMRWLVRLVTPPGGLILDPFIGSGSTAIAAKAEGMRCMGIDQEAEYLEIARHRTGDGPLFTMAGGAP